MKPLRSVICKPQWIKIDKKVITKGVNKSCKTFITQNNVQKFKFISHRMKEEKLVRSNFF